MRAHYDKTKNTSALVMPKSAIADGLKTTLIFAGP